MFLLEQYDSVRERYATVQGPPWDHLGTIFAQIQKLVSRRLGIDLGSSLVTGGWVIPTSQFKSR